MRMNLSRASTSHSSHRPRRCGAVLGAGLLACACALPASADIETLLASYEPYETDLTVTRGSQDAGLTVTPVLGGRNGVPPATHGEYVLKVEVEDVLAGKINSSVAKFKIVP